MVPRHRRETIRPLLRPSCVVLSMTLESSAVRALEARVRTPYHAPLRAVAARPAAVRSSDSLERATLAGRVRRGAGGAAVPALGGLGVGILRVVGRRVRRFAGVGQ